MMPYMLCFVSGYALTLTAVYYLDLRHRGVFNKVAEGGKK